MHGQWRRSGAATTLNAGEWFTRLREAELSAYAPKRLGSGGEDDKRWNAREKDHQRNGHNIYILEILKQLLLQSLREERVHKGFVPGLALCRR